MNKAELVLDRVQFQPITKLAHLSFCSSIIVGEFKCQVWLIDMRFDRELDLDRIS